MSHVLARKVREEVVPHNSSAMEEFVVRCVLDTVETLIELRKEPFRCPVGELTEELVARFAPKKASVDDVLDVVDLVGLQGTAGVAGTATATRPTAEQVASEDQPENKQQDQKNFGRG